MAGYNISLRKYYRLVLLKRRMERYSLYFLYFQVKLAKLK